MEREKKNRPKKGVCLCVCSATVFKQTIPPPKKGISGTTPGACFRYAHAVLPFLSNDPIYGIPVASEERGPLFLRCSACASLSSFPNPTESAMHGEAAGLPKIRWACFNLHFPLRNIFIIINNNREQVPLHTVQ